MTDIYSQKFNINPMDEFSKEEYRKLEGFETGGTPLFPEPNGPLINTLMTDFSSPRSDADREVLDDPGSHFIDRLIAFSPKRPSREEAKVRYHSSSAQQLALGTRRMLDDAAITSTFKHRIVDEVRRAYAEEKPVTDDIAPDRLGLTDGSNGIFDEEAAPVIEATHLRFFLLRIVGKNLRHTKPEDNDIEATTVLHPVEFKVDMQGLNSWIKDYMNKFKQSPLDDLNQRAYLLAAQVYEEMTKS